jgi:hypothetical protein
MEGGGWGYQDDKIKEDEIGRACSMHGRIRNLYYKVLIRKCEEKRPLGRPSA